MQQMLKLKKQKQSTNNIYLNISMELNAQNKCEEMQHFAFKKTQQPCKEKRKEKD